MTDPREHEPPDRGNEDSQQDDDWKALIEGWPPDGVFTNEDVFTDD
jgi:hypothetical protein